MASKIENRLQKLEQRVKPDEANEVIYVWNDPETGEARHDKPPADTSDWIHVTVNCQAGAQ